MNVPVTEDLQRLASRLALLTSEDGEAENAARAAGQLARRLGLSGGHLKAIFLAGVRAAGLKLPEPLDEAAAETINRLEQELAELRRLLDRSDEQVHALMRQRAELIEHNEALREALDRSRSARQVWRISLLVALAAALGAAGLAVVGPRLGFPLALGGGEPPSGSALLRQAVAGPGGTRIRGTADLDAPVLATLVPGTKLPVRRLLWQGFRQWIETDIGGQAGYAPATEIDLR